MTGLADLPPLREVIRAHGLAARKSLGQNFILDLNLTSKIARAAGDLSASDVVEVGPGPGGLTRGLLLEGARRVVVIEKDARCIPALEDIAAVDPRLTIIEGDALAVDFSTHARLPVKIVANLPYNIGTELLTRWLDPGDWPPVWSSLTLMFQREVAERIVAPCGTKAYGRLSVLSQWRSSARIVMDLPPSAFVPAPKVKSAVVHIEALDMPRFPANAKILQHLVKTAFNQRRKMLRSSLKSLAPNIEEILEVANVAPTQRAEAVDLEGFCAVAQALEKTGYSAAS
ncbi:MAG: 16S rRNA (adenine(1518)-N(6)/adenine(1519)-N(6))-dimethyltransferase RsmA [Pseudomonadota bacterium]